LEEKEFVDDIIIPNEKEIDLKLREKKIMEIIVVI